MTDRRFGWVIFTICFVSAMASLAYSEAARFGSKCVVERIMH
jgi:hypothetical protein